MARRQPRARAPTAGSSDPQTRPAPPGALAPTPPLREPRPAPRARARRPLTRPAPARGHAPVPVLLWRPAPPRVCVVVGGRPSLTRTRLAGAREPAVRGVSWAGRRADVAPGCGQVRSRLRRHRLSCHRGLYENTGRRAARDPLPCGPGAAGAEAERSPRQRPRRAGERPRRPRGPPARPPAGLAPGGASAHLAGGGEARCEAGRPAGRLSVERAAAASAPCAARRAPLPATPPTAARPRPGTL